MKTLALSGVALATVAIALAYASAFLPGGAPGWAAPLLAAGTAVVLVSMMALGAQRRGRVGSLWVPFAFVLVVVGGGLLALLAIPANEGPGTALVLGLPPRAALLLFGVGLFPTLVVPVAYALTFDTLTLGHDDLERVKHAAWARRAGLMESPDEGAPTIRAGGEAPAGADARTGERR